MKTQDDFIICDDLNAEPVDPEKLERAYERMEELFEIVTEELPNGNTVTTMKRRKEGEENERLRKREDEGNDRRH